MKIKLQLVALFFFQSSYFLYGQTFTDLQNGFSTLSNASTAWADYDNDGDMDFALIGFSSVSAEIGIIYHNDSNGMFSMAFSLPFPVSSGAVSWGDYDHDGDLDLLVNGQNGSGGAVTTLYRNDGSNVFTPVTTSLPGIVGITRWLDYDGDGWLDVLMSGVGNSFSGDSTRLFHNDTNGAFSEVMINLPGYFPSDISIVDFDHDGDMDFFLTGGTITFSTFPITRLYQNNGNGVFTNVPFNFRNLSTGTSAWTDNDSDGDVDLLYNGTDSTGLGITVIYRNDGAGNFTLLNANLPGSGEPGSVAWADIDNDGDLDILLGGPQTLLRNDGSNIYSDITPASFQSSVPCSFADMDNDGDPDILLISQSGGSFASTIYRNENITVIKEINSESTIQVYPNPANDILTIQLNSATKDFTLTVFNTLGEQVFKSSTSKNLDVSSFLQGMYFIQIKSNNHDYQSKFIKQ